MSTVFQTLTACSSTRWRSSCFQRSSEDDGFVARLGEALAAAKLVHPNIVQVYNWGHDGDAHRYYIGDRVRPPARLSVPR